MPMPPYPIRCHQPDCSEPAIYKIAARWSDGVTEELKTYSLCCAACLTESLRQSRKRRARCRLSGNETLDEPGVYALIRGQRDRRLKRMVDIENQLG